MRYHVTVHYRTPKRVASCMFDMEAEPDRAVDEAVRIVRRKHPRIYRLDVVSLIPQTFTKGN